MPSNTLPLLPTSIVLFQAENNNTCVKIYVDGVQLGIINGSSPVTVYVSNGSSRTITWKTISNSQYIAGNNNERGKDTFATTIDAITTTITFGVCGSGSNYKIIGWDDEVIGQIFCTGGFEQFFACNSDGEFKCMAEQVTVAGITKWKLFVRYGQNVCRQGTKPSALCDTATYCYVCN